MTLLVVRVKTKANTATTCACWSYLVQARPFRTSFWSCLAYSSVSLLSPLHAFQPKPATQRSICYPLPLLWLDPSDIVAEQTLASPSAKPARKRSAPHTWTGLDHRPFLCQRMTSPGRPSLHYICVTGEDSWWRTVLTYFNTWVTEWHLLWC